jgi:molybdopterin molybdotransferase
VISWFDALAAVREAGARRMLGTEVVPIERAGGRVTAEAIAARDASPRFDNAGMDGFAIRAADAARARADAPARLRIAGRLLAGEDPAQVAPAAAGAAVEIMTGAPVPAGFDAVVRYEDVEIDRAAGAVLLREPVTPRENVRPRGDDFDEGEPLVAAGIRMSCEHVMVLATAGVPEVAVRRVARIAVVATGKELVPHGARALPAGAVRNSNLPYLRVAAEGAGATCVLAEAVGDDVDAFEAAIRRARDLAADVVLTSGGVSMGAHDFVAEALARAGARERFHKVAIRPGKPVLFAEVDGGPAIFALPGNPVASAVNFRFLAVPFLRSASGLPAEPPVRAVLARDTRKPAGLRCFYKASAEGGPRGTTVEVLPGQGSASVAPLVRANAWAVLPEEGDRCAAGTELDIFPLNPSGTWAPPPGGAR